MAGAAAGGARDTAADLAAGFLAAPASAIARGYAAIGGRLRQGFEDDRRRTIATAPTFRAELRGGAASPAVPAPVPAPTPSGAPAAAAVPAKPKAKAPRTGAASRAGAVYQPDAASDLDNADHDLAGGRSTAAAGGAAAAASLGAHPGAERVQPAELSKSARLDLPPAEQQVPTSASPEMQDYADLALPESVRERADGRMAPRLDRSLAGPRGRVAAARAQEERARTDAIDRATAEAAELSARSQQRQDEIVAGAHGDIEARKQASVAEAQGEVAKFDQEAGDRHQDTVARANDRIAGDQKRADQKVAEAHQQADDKRREGKEQEAAEHREAARKKKNRKWWQKIGDFFADLAKAVAKAVKRIVDAVEKFVNKVLDAAKKFVGQVIKALSQAIQGMLKVFAGIVKALVDNLIGRIFPGIAARLDAAIDAVVDVACKAVDAVAQGLSDAVDWLVTKAQQAVSAAASVARAAIAIATTLVVGLVKGDFLEALKAAFLAACDELGLPGQQLLDMLARAGKLIWEVVKHPATFLKHLLQSIWGGIKLFVADIVPNFVKGLMGWIFGEVAATGVVLPDKFDLRGILGIVLQVVGLTLDNVRAQAVAVFGERNVQFAEGVIKFVGILFAKGPGAFFSQLLVAAKALPGLLFESAASWAEARFGERGRRFVEGIRADFDALLSGGPAALLQHMLGQLGAIKDAVIDGIRQWVMEKVVAVAVEKLATMTNPVGGFIQAILMIYRTIQFFVERIKQILEVVNRILDSIETVAKGLIQVAARAIDKTMIATLPLVITFLAELIGIGGIGEKVRKIVARIQAPVIKALVWLFGKIKAGIEWVVAKFKGLVGGRKEKAPSPAAAGGAGAPSTDAAAGATAPLEIRAEGEVHHIWTEAGRDGLRVILASDPLPLARQLELWKQRAKQAPRGLQWKLNTAIKECGGLLKSIEQLPVSKDVEDRRRQTAELSEALRGALVPLVTYFESPELAGAFAVYRGQHFAKDFEEKRGRTLEEDSAHPGYSAATWELAARRVGWDRGDRRQHLDAANQVVKQQLEVWRTTTDLNRVDESKESIRAWEIQRRRGDSRVPEGVRQGAAEEDLGGQWSRKDRAFENQFAGALSRYVDKQSLLEKELQAGSVKGYSDVPFTKLPFVSTSKFADTAVKYAMGNLTAADARSTSREVGKVLVFVSGRDEFLAEQGVDVWQELERGTLRFTTHRQGEEEITFSGNIPARWQRATTPVRLGEPRQNVNRAEIAAAKAATAFGGLLPMGHNQPL